MSSKLFKTVFAGAVAAGALLLMPVTAAQASAKHHPCDGPGFGHGAFFGHDGFRDGGFWDDGFGPWDDDFGFPRHHRHHDTTVIVVTVPQKAQGHHHKPATTGGANADAAGNGYTKPAATSNGGGYRKNA
jgi:hypothetical protein